MALDSDTAENFGLSKNATKIQYENKMKIALSIRGWAVLASLICHHCLAAEVPRTADGAPNLQGIWMAEERAHVSLDLQIPSWELPPTMGFLEGGGEIPYLPHAAQTQQVNFDNRFEADPLENCYLPGVPRIMTMPHPFAIWQTSDHIAMTFEWTQVFRLIYTGGQEQMYTGFPSWMGHSSGEWQGDTLVVSVIDQNGKTWFDKAGNFGSEALRLTEYFRMIDADTIEYRVEFEDENTYSEPWSIKLTLKRQEHIDRILEYQCQAEKEETTGDFEADENTWYGFTPDLDLQPFDEDASSETPLLNTGFQPALGEHDQPLVEGYYYTDNGGTNYGFVPATGRMHPDSRGVIIDPPQGVVPYQPWAALEQRDREEPYRGYDDPTAHCFVAGLPRSLYVPAPFFILQPKDHVVFLHERMSYRVVYLNSELELPDSVRLWQGHSTGEWRDGTLYVDSTNFNGKAWLNEIGDVTTHAQLLHESFTPVDESQLIYRATIHDPIAFTRPWTIELPLNREESQLLEVACLEDNNDLEILRDVRDAHREQIDARN